MELDNIEKLVEKYFEATTTVAEEEILKRYFTQENAATHLEQYAPMFQYFSKAKEEKFTKRLPMAHASSISRRSIYKWMSVAAVVVLMFGIYFGGSLIKSDDAMTLEDQYTQEEIASAQEAFQLLALNFNKGAEKIGYLSEFEKTTHKFLVKE
jgi:hypothetical protein